MIVFKDDEFWCRKCGTFHPTPHWHDKYDDYEMMESVEKKWRESIYPRFFSNLSWDETKRIMLQNMSARPYREVEQKGKCCVCGNDTHFVSRKTNEYVCSDGCLYQHEGRTI